MNSKICKRCGDEFIPKSPKQLYCKKEIELICPVCGDKYAGYCQPENPTTCDKPECKRQAASIGSKNKTKICRVCGKPFTPNSARQMDCNQPVTRICVVCGKPFIAKCSMSDKTKTCSKECLIKYTHQQQLAGYASETRICELCGKPFTPTNNTQQICNDVHYRKCEVCGKEFELDTSKNKVDWPKTCSKECAAVLRSKNNGMHDPHIVDKYRQSYFDKTGYDHPMKNPEVVSKVWSTYKLNTGYAHPSHNPLTRSNWAKHSKLPSTELKVINILENYSIRYIHRYTIQKGSKSHEFDFFLPELKLLLDCDGIYYHGYISDPDGKHVIDYYDEDRIALVPEGHRFHVIVEGNESNDLKMLIKLISDSGFSGYDSHVFKWCRQVGFPYPQYSDERLHSEFRKLKTWDLHQHYSPNCRIGDSIIKQFHRSIWSCKVGSYASPLDAWNSDELLLKVIHNRLIYVNTVDPSKVLSGFNISKICPRVSIFNPILAKYVCEKYLQNFQTVFDPFSGFSGRLLGAVSTGKDYIGQDLNDVAVSETKMLIDYFNLNDSANVVCRDILASEGKFECLFTCPPYDNKEIYSSESVFKSCDDWIDECIDRFECSRYIFVVDTTEKYKTNVAEEIQNTSHFVNFREKIILIDK